MCLCCGLDVDELMLMRCVNVLRCSVVVLCCLDVSYRGGEQHARWH